MRLLVLVLNIIIFIYNYGNIVYVLYNLGW